jgi:crotonobetainyl-CoA:carnitine CoA-transferase CaiB-like acyl-CoA transferase
MSLNGHPDAPPAKVPVAALDFGSALYGVIGIMAALRRRDTSGRGEWVQTSLLETGLAWLSMHVTSLLAGGEEPQRLGTRSPFFAPYEAYATADGHLVVVGTGEGWPALCGVLGLDDLPGDPRFATNSDRVANAEALREEIEAVLRGRTTAEWEPRLREAGVPSAPVQRLPEVLASEQVEALGALATLPHPTAGEFPIVRLPVSFGDSAATATEPPPALDADATRRFS